MSEAEAVFEHDAMTELAREALEESDESAHAYLVQSWLSSAIEKLYDARRQAGLTQEEVAQLLGTKQPAIARLERDDEGKVSLHRYVAFALACGFLPLDISLRPTEALREYALDDPDAPRTEAAFEAWNSEAFAYSSVAPVNYFGMDFDAWSLTTNSALEFDGIVEEPEDEFDRTVVTAVRRALKETAKRKIRDDYEREDRRIETTVAKAATAATAAAA
jgi:transcriptional regulator with XRE-family HTH domain